MKFVITMFVLSFTAIALAYPSEEKYTDRYDKINLDDILSNPKILESHVNCLLEKGRCTPEAKELKEKIIDALENECAKCTEPQKKGVRRVISHLINHEEGHWKQLTDKYDPQKKYANKYEKQYREIKSKKQ